MIIETKRLCLVPWHDGHRTPFADMCADAEVMADLGGPLDRDAAMAKLTGYQKAFREHGVSRLALEDRSATFMGYVGIMRHQGDHPIGAHFDIGWRLVRGAWGYGYASEAAGAVLKDFFKHCDVNEVLAYTSPNNHRSADVMRRLDMERRPELDFAATYAGVTWQGRVSAASRRQWPSR